MAQPKDIARAGARLGLGLVGVAVAVLTVGAALVVNAPTHSTTPVATRVTPVPTAATVACPGPLLGLDSDSSATALASFDNAAIVVGTPEAGSGRRELAAPDDGAGGGYGAPLAYTVPARSGGGSAPQLGVAQSQSASLDDLAGFAATACAEPSSDSWISAGATDLGENSIVLLTNPGAVATTVDLQVYSEQGAVAAPASKGIVVQPGTQNAVSLAGIAPNAQATVVHVTASGGSILASLEQSLVTGVTPQGVELAAPTAGPATHLIIPGAVFPAVAAGAATAAPSDAGDASPSAAVLRVYVPGSRPASLNIAFAGEKGNSLAGAQTVSVSGGVVSEVPLDRTAAGSYTVTVDSDRPVVASVRTSAIGKTGTDFAWFAATIPLTGSAQLAIANGPAPVLHLANPSVRTATVALTAEGKPTRTISIPADSAIGIPSTAGGVQLSGADGLYASVSYSGDGQLASYPITPPGAGAGALKVYTK